MTVGAGFNGSTSYIESTTGTDLTATNITIGFLIYLAGTTLEVPLGAYLTSTTRLGPYITGNTFGWEMAGAAAEDTGATFAAGNWYLILASKAAGSATPRLHKYDGTTWRHQDLDGPLSDLNGSIDRISVGAERNNGVTAKSVNGEIAWAGIWAETTSDLTAESYTNFTTVQAKANQQFFTGTSLVAGGTMDDVSANNNDETGRSTTTATHDVPAWITNFPANTGTLGRATRLIEFVKQVGTVTNSTAATTSAITVAAGGVPVGNTVIIVLAADNSGSNGAIQATTVSDTRGNTWNYTTHAIADPGAANAGSEGSLAWAYITVALQASDTITISWPASTTAKACRADEFRYVGVLIEQQVENNQTGQAVTLTTTPTGIGQLVIGGVAVEGGTADAFTQDADTTNGSWVNPGRLGSGTTTAGSTLNPIYKIVTAPGAQTYGGATMLGTARDHCSMLAVFACNPYDVRPDAFGRHRGRARTRRR